MLRACGSLAPQSYCPPAGVLFPAGHIVAETAPIHVQHLYAVPSPAKFEQDLDFLCRHYQPLPLSDLEQLSARRGRPVPAQQFVLSFDDGMREVYDVIAPILRAQGLPAIFFINSSTVDNRQMMWRNKISILIERCSQLQGQLPASIGQLPGENLPAKLKALRFADNVLIDELARSLEVDFEDYLRREQPYLTSSQIQELARDGFEFGAHSDRHPLFPELTVEQQKQEILASVNFIRDLGLPCRCFAFPFHDGGVLAEVFRYMSDLKLVLSLGTSDVRVDSVGFSFQRFAIDAENAETSLSSVLKELSAKFLLRQWSGTAAINRN
jgi:peptidoglycan/xylan/chitin deacetylase (PgdA/CDA1 family)